MMKRNPFLIISFLLSFTSCSDFHFDASRYMRFGNPKPLKSFAIGGKHTCALASNDAFYCWGRNFYGQIGNSLTDEIPVIKPSLIDNFLSSSEKIIDIGLGYTHSCVLTSLGKLFCWGNNASGGVGVPQISWPKVYAPELVNLPLAGGEKVTSLFTGGHHTCVLTSAKNAYCWGNNNKGQLGINHLDPFRDVPTLINQSTLAPGEYFIDLKLGYLHTCGLTNQDKVYCWGSNENGQGGYGSANPTSLIPTPVDLSMFDTNERPMKLFSGYYSNCIISSKNKSYCWGSNNNGGLGLGVVGGHYSLPTLLSDFSTSQQHFTSFSLGFYFACGITNTEKLYCWGRNSKGQLGDESFNDRSSPTPVSSALEFRLIKVGDYHSCATSKDGYSYCWGSNTDGQLGLKNLSETTLPVLVPEL